MDLKELSNLTVEVSKKQGCQVEKSCNVQQFKKSRKSKEIWNKKNAHYYLLFIYFNYNFCYLLITKFHL